MRSWIRVRGLSGGMRVRLAAAWLFAVVVVFEVVVMPRSAKTPLIEWIGRVTHLLPRR